MFEHHARSAAIFALRWVRAKSSCRVLFRLRQHVIQKRAEVGLDDLEFARCHRDGLWKVVDDLGAIEHDHRMANRARQLGPQTTSWPGLSTSTGAGDGRSSYDQVGPGSIARIRFPPHRTSQSSVTLWPARIVLIRTIDAGYQGERKLGLKRPENWSSLGVLESNRAPVEAAGEIQTCA
jgi:hypothetical protein